MAADPILSSLVGKLVDYVAVHVGRQFSYLFRYKGNLEEFTSLLRELETAELDVKQRVEADKRNGKVILRGVEDWLKRVEVVSDESKPFVGEEDAISKSCFNGPLNLKVRYQRSRKAKKKAAEFDRIKKDGIFDVVSAPAPPPPIGAMNNENEFDFESRKSVFKEIMDAIKDDGVDMIGIWGMPGIGKTTLVKRVGKYAKDEGLFEVVAMAGVSQNPSVKDIQGQITDAIGLKLTSESQEGRANQLLERLLAMKKILVILDDVWDSLELNDIGIPYGSQHKGCKIILTSRKRGVCEEMRTGKNFKIDLLSANEALSLFLKMSGIDDRSSEKGRLAESLSKECGRLPICIVIVAKGLLNKEEAHWTDTLNRLRNSDPDSRVRDAIELSYKGEKREEEKTFFLLCALFPEDYNIRVQVLFQYGIGLDLFEKVDNVDEALVRAHKLASSLKSSSLLLDARSEEHVKMHDVVRDAALAIASKGKNAFLVRSAAPWREWSEKTAISLWSDDVKKLPNGLECPQLQILMLNCKYPNLQLPDNFFVGMRNLIVLDMFEMEFGRLPESFAGLENLRTLRLSFCKLGDISTIGKLQNLVSLSFFRSNIEVLPKEVGELSNLTLLDLSGCVILKAITPGVIQNLSQLEALLMRNACVSELIYLSRLKMLEIHIPDASKLPDDVLFGNLTKFNIVIGGDPYQFFFPDFPLSSQILKLKRISENEVTKAGIKTLMKKAQHLELDDVSGIYVALPSHLGGFRTLKELLVSHCKDVKYVLDVSESEYEPDTPLQKLHLIRLPLLKEISRGKFPSMLFSELDYLRLYDLPSLVHLWQFPTESVALSNLTTMEVTRCNELKYVFEQSTAKSLLKLKKLEVEYCRNLEAIYLTKEEEQGNVIDFPQLSHFKLSELMNLTSFGSKFTSESTLFGEQVIFRALEKLDINNIKKLEKIWHAHTLAESFLKLKVLKLTNCPELLVIFPPQATSYLQNLEEICIENCDKLEILVRSDDVPLTVGDDMILFPRLLTLKLVNLPKFTAIVSTTSQNIFQNTEIMTLCKLHNLESIVNFPKLKMLHLVGVGRLSSSADQLHIIEELEALEELIIEHNNGKTLLTVIATLPKLKTLQLRLIREPIDWSESLYRAKVFQSLTSLNFYCCIGLKSLLTSSAVRCLVQLQELFINECAFMGSVVGKTSGEQNFDKVIEFSKLHTLTLKNLPRLTSFYDGECPLKFPCLGTISIKHCSRLKMFTSMTRETPEPSHQNFFAEALFGQQVSFGRLSHLKLEQVELIEEIWYHDHPVTTVGDLHVLKVKCCDRLLKIFPSNLLAGLQNLENLQVHSCASLEHVFAVEDHPPFLSNLKQLELENLPKLKQLWWNENTCESFGLPSLQSFFMEDCPALQYVFDASVADHLEKLRSVYVWNCSSIVEIVEEKPGSKIMFPVLHTLRLDNLPCFKGLNPYVEFPQVKYVEVDHCLNINEWYRVNGEHVRNIQLQGSMSFFESVVQCWKTGMDKTDDHLVVRQLRIKRRRISQ